MVDKILTYLCDELEGADFSTIVPYTNRERAEVYRINILNKIIARAKELKLPHIAWLAQEAKENDDAGPVIDAIRQMLQ